MKKKLEAELISIAHRILKLKNKSDLIQLHQETQKLFEKLSVLKFVEENFSDVKPTIGYAAIEEKLAVAFDSETPVEVETFAAEEQTIAAQSELDTPVESTEKEEAVQPEAEIKQEEAAPITETIPNEIETPKVEVKESNSVTDQIEKSGKAIADLIKGIRGNSPKKDEVVETAASEPMALLEVPDEIGSPVEVENEKAKSHNIKAEEISETKLDNETETVQADQLNKKEDTFKPAFEWGFESKTEEIKPAAAQITPSQISFDDLLGQSYKDPIFVKPEDLHHEKETVKPVENSAVIPISRNFNDTANVISINKSDTLNDRISRGITIGLNDRIAFMNHLFNNSSEDYNRVLSQLITLDTLDEAKSFIDTMVKPDYNDWLGKEEYEQRFMEIIEKKFS